MPLWPKVNSLWRSLMERQKVEDDLTNEIRSYCELLEQQKIREGVDPVTARREASIELGAPRSSRKKFATSAAELLLTSWAQNFGNPSAVFAAILR